MTVILSLVDLAHGKKQKVGNSALQTDILLWYNSKLAKKELVRLICNENKNKINMYAISNTRTITRKRIRNEL